MVDAFSFSFFTTLEVCYYVPLPRHLMTNESFFLLIMQKLRGKKDPQPPVKKHRGILDP